MPTIKKYSTRSAFTLMEMLIVVILMGVIYSLMLNYLKPKKEKISLLLSSPFRALLLPYWHYSHVILLCEHKCEKCMILDSNGSILARDISYPLKDFRGSRVYRLSYDGKLDEVTFVQPFPSEERVCFRYDLYPNKSSSELFLENEDGTVLYLPPYFNDTKKFASLNQAESYFEDLKLELTK